MDNKIYWRTLKYKLSLYTLIALVEALPEKQLNMRYFQPEKSNNPLKACFSTHLQLKYASSEEEKNLSPAEFFMAFLQISPEEARILLLSAEIYATTRLDRVSKDKILEVLRSIYVQGFIEVKDNYTKELILRQYASTTGEK